MKFRSKNKDLTRLASTTGHVCLVGEDWVDVPEHMEGDAYSKGCISEEMRDTIKESLENDGGEKDQEPGILSFDPETDEGKRNAEIKWQVDKMIDEPKPSDFTARGMPNLKVLSERCKFPVAKVQMEVVWNFIQAERDAAEAE